MSRKRPRRWHPPPCATGKVAFRSRGRALAAIRQIEIGDAQAAVAPATKPVAAYRCRCGAWHLTSRPQS